jgi:UDP-glucose 4-epimerase
MKVLVTGGAGFIGSNIVDALIAKNHQVLILDNISTGKRQNLNPQAKLYELDLTSAAAAEMIVNEKPEIVFHLGAQIDVRKSIAEPEFDRKINVGGSKNLLDAAEKAGVKKFIFSSTGGAIYGETNILPSPETTPNNPLSQYGKSKLEVDREMEARSRAGSKMVMVSLRYGNVFGPRQDPLGEAGVISIFGNGLLKGKPIFINGDGKQTRDYVFVGDVVQANLLAMEKCEQHQIFNVGTGIETNVLQIVDLLKDIIKPANPLVSHRETIAGEVLRSLLDASKIKQQLGWQPQVSLAQGMQKFVEWLKTQG